MKHPQRLKIYKGNIFTDERGAISFVNSFHFKNVKRFYMVENAHTEMVRGFHGHMKEGKYYFVVSGSVLLCAVLIDNPENPSIKNKVHAQVLSVKNPAVFYIPPGYANGIKMLEANSKLLVFSTSTLKQSEKDSYRYPFDYWGKEIWNI